MSPEEFTQLVGLSDDWRYRERIHRLHDLTDFRTEMPNLPKQVKELRASFLPLDPDTADIDFREIFDCCASSAYDLFCSR